jgi:lipoic acid synthetase/lipoyl(octanoyl) transferase
MSKAPDPSPPHGSAAGTACLALCADRLVPYEEGLSAQTLVHGERLADRCPDTLLLLQHAPVVTLGRRGREEGLRTDRTTLNRLGIEIFKASRGGDVTYHAPGQWVLYPILKLGSREADAHGYLFNLEEVAIRTAADFGVPAFRRTGMSGAWTDAGKIAAIGFHLKHWITLHGMSFNVNLDLRGFDHIIPCGLASEPVASLASRLGSQGPALGAVAAALLSHFQEVFGRVLQTVRSAADLPDGLSRLGPILFRPTGPEAAAS